MGAGKSMACIWLYRVKVGGYDGLAYVVVAIVRCPHEGRSPIGGVVVHFVGYSGSLIK